MMTQGVKPRRIRASVFRGELYSSHTIFNNPPCHQANILFYSEEGHSLQEMKSFQASAGTPLQNGKQP